MFLLNSCLGHFSAACSRRHPFSRSYGAILPSSLTMLLPPALGFSPHLPVSVCGTGTVYTIAAFPGSSVRKLRYFCSLRITSSDWQLSGLPPIPLAPVFSFPALPTSPRPRSSDIQQYWNLNQLSIGYAFRPLLRSRLPQSRSALLWKPQIFGREDSHLTLATHSGILSSQNSTSPFGNASSL